MKDEIPSANPPLTAEEQSVAATLERFKKYCSRRTANEFMTTAGGCRFVAQVSKPAVSPISKSADHPQVGTPAARQTWKSALRPSTHFIAL
jgi:hypothetical protein